MNLGALFYLLAAYPKSPQVKRPVLNGLMQPSNSQMKLGKVDMVADKNGVAKGIDQRAVLNGLKPRNSQMKLGKMGAVADKKIDLGKGTDQKQKFFEIRDGPKPPPIIAPQAQEQNVQLTLVLPNLAADVCNPNPCGPGYFCDVRACRGRVCSRGPQYHCKRITTCKPNPCPSDYRCEPEKDGDGYTCQLSKRPRHKIVRRSAEFAGGLPIGYRPGNFQTCNEKKPPCENGYECKEREVHCFMAPCPQITTCEPVLSDEMPSTDSVVAGNISDSRGPGLNRRLFQMIMDTSEPTTGVKDAKSKSDGV